MRAMSIWGKLTGALAGYALANAPGAVFGALVGHFALDRTRDPALVFTIALIALAAKITRADGTITTLELEAVQRVLRVPEREQANLARVFRLAQEDVAGFDSYARQIVRIYHDAPHVLEEVLDVLFYIACADGVLHPAEEQFLSIVANIFALPKSHYEHIKARHVLDTSDPWRLLGLSPDSDTEAARLAYIEAVRDNHPDKLLAHGVPPEMIHIATARMAAINNAWEMIRKERNL